MSNNSDGVRAGARQLAGRLAEAFEQDRALAEQQTRAQHRLQAANGQLWSGLHPDALGLLYDDTACGPTRALPAARASSYARVAARACRHRRPRPGSAGSDPAGDTSWVDAASMGDASPADRTPLRLLLDLL